MRRPSAYQIRKSFLDYFVGQKHTIVPSSSVVPKNDSSVAFVSAGMNQFKTLFLGAKYDSGKFSDLRNVVNWQKCIRIGGKHNDLECVGRDLTHHTFFEMLGNYSFGGYSKKDACRYAWEFLTDVLKLSPKRLYVTYFSGDQRLNLQSDSECQQIWREIGLPNNRVLPFGSTHNFWDMADTGPCGPCSEIHYSMLNDCCTPELVNVDGSPVLELWNLVFMQYNRDAGGKISSLPKLNVDCGMGFERLVSVVQGVNSTYDTDLFVPLMDAIKMIAKVDQYRGKVGTDDRKGVDTAYRVVADHLRAIIIMISDGVIPGSQNRGFQLRRLIRRATRNLSLVLGSDREALTDLVPSFIGHMGCLYENVVVNPNEIKEVVHKEEKAFWKKFDAGNKVLRRQIDNLPPANKILPGNIAWLLKSQHGLPFDLVEQICERSGVTVDAEGFNNCLSQLKRKQTYEAELWRRIDLKNLNSLISSPTEDSSKYNYKRNRNAQYVFPSKSGKVLALVNMDANIVNQLLAGEEGCVIMDSTNFFAEHDGQACDIGHLFNIDNEPLFKVKVVKKRGVFVMLMGEVCANACLEKDMTINQVIDCSHRFAIMCNHTALHILNFVLKEFFNRSIHHLASVVTADYFQLDVMIDGLEISSKELEKVEDYVNQIIVADAIVRARNISHEEIGAIQNSFSTFDAARDASVSEFMRIIEIENSNQYHAISKIMEPCTGTHVERTGDLVKFVFLGNKGRGSKARRLFGTTSTNAVKSIENANRLKKKMLDILSEDRKSFINISEFIEDLKVSLPIFAKTNLFTLVKEMRKRNKDFAAKQRNLPNSAEVFKN